MTEAKDRGYNFYDCTVPLDNVEAIPHALADVKARLGLDVVDAECVRFKWTETSPELIRFTWKVEE